MKIIARIAVILCFCIVKMGLFPLLVIATEKNNPLSPQQIFTRADAHFEKLNALSFTVDRTMSMGLQKQEERWNVFVQRPESFRVEYQGPPKRIVLAKTDFYSEYIPQAKKALELKLSELSEKSREEVHTALMLRVAIPGFRVGVTEKMLSETDFKVLAQEEKSGRPVYLIEGKDKTKVLAKDGLGVQSAGLMRLWIDRERFTLIRVEVYDGKQFISSIENFGFQDLGNGIWLPIRIEVTNNNAKGMEKVIYRISNLVPNSALNAKLFDVTYGEGVKVTRNEKKADVKTP